MTVQQLSNSDTVDGTSCSAFAQETEAQRSRSADKQLSQNKLDQLNLNRRADDGGAMCSEQKQSKTIIMHSNEKIEDKIDTMTVTTCNTDGYGGNNNEQKFNKSTTNRSKNINCDNFNEYEANERKRGGMSAAAAANGGGGGISSDSGVGFELGLDDDDTDEDPYAELEFYLEKVKVSIFFLYFVCFLNAFTRWVWRRQTVANLFQFFFCWISVFSLRSNSWQRLTKIILSYFPIQSHPIQN